MQPRSGVFSDLKAPLKTVLLFSLVINLALLAPALFMLQVFDRVLATRSVETLVMLGAATVATLVLMGVLEHLRARLLVGVGISLEQRHGPRLLSQLALATAREGGGGYLNGMRDLATLRAFLSGPGVAACCDAPWTVIYLGLIYLFHPVLGMVATGCAVLLLLLAVLGERLTRKAVEDLREGSIQTGRMVDGTLRQTETLLAMGLTGAMVERWRRLTERTQRLQLQVSRGGGAVSAATKFTRQAVQVVTLGVGAYLVIHEHATPGIMLATTIILGRALAPVEMLVGSWKPLIEARASWGRLVAVLARPAEGEVATELPRPSGRLSAEAVSYSPPGSGRALLRGVSLQCQPGQVLALVGPSGAGKTTLARLLVGVLVPSAGTVRLDGAELRSWAPERLGPWLGYVPQDVQLFEGTVADNIARMGPADADAVLRAAQQAHVHELILRLPAGYDTPVGEGGRALSAGQRQRIALARALYGEPALVVLDEPDASLDADGEQALLEAIRGLRTRGAAVVVSTQRRAVLSVADHVAVMRDGLVERVAAVEPQPQASAAPPGLPARASAGGGR